MKKNTAIFIGFIGLAIVALLLTTWTMYNSMVTTQENVNNTWANVESQYQRRLDLIPNLVSVVKGYATHEQETLTAVTEARSKATNMTLDPADLTAENLQKFQETQNQLNSALSRLIMIQEQYPDLKANQNFLELQAQLEGTENRINVARNRFNTAAKDYNTSIRKFPGNIVASAFGFETKPYFKAQEGAENATEVDF